MSIKNWKEDDRPREKFYLKGKNSVSDSELLAILIGMGTKENSALDIAKRVLEDNENSLQNVSQLSVKELMSYKGLGIVKAITIAAALELGNRKLAETSWKKNAAKSSRDLFQILQPYFASLKQEEFYIVLFNRALHPLKVQRISIGKTDATLVDLKVIAKLAVENLASAIAISHNHPSGNLSPSKEDDVLTEKVKDALKVFDIKVIDHLILYENQYYSYADEGKL